MLSATDRYYPSVKGVCLFSWQLQNKACHFEYKNLLKLYKITPLTMKLYLLYHRKILAFNVLWQHTLTLIAFFPAITWIIFERKIYPSIYKERERLKVTPLWQNFFKISQKIFIPSYNSHENGKSCRLNANFSQKIFYGFNISQNFQDWKWLKRHFRGIL